MKEIRFAKKSDIQSLKEIWKKCFGDSDSYIDLYFNNRFKESETLVLIENDEVAAMLTMLPVKLNTTESECVKAAMIYAVATAPQLQGKGLSTTLIDHAVGYLRENNVNATVLVPSEKELFNFYSRLGYRAAFYLREIKLSVDDINRLSFSNPAYIDSSQINIISADPKEYNIIREKFLKDNFFVSYYDEEIRYQKKISQQTDTDIYILQVAGESQACVTIERINADSLLIKEILSTEVFIINAIKTIAQILPAKDFIVRTPPFTYNQFFASYNAVRPFGMLLADDNIIDEIGYLGLAFD